MLTNINDNCSNEIMLQNVSKVKPKAVIDRNKPFLFRVVIFRATLVIVIINK